MRSLIAAQKSLAAKLEANKLEVRKGFSGINAKQFMVFFDYKGMKDFGIKVREIGTAELSDADGDILWRGKHEGSMSFVVDQVLAVLKEEVA